MTMTSARVSYLYDLMDAAHDAAAIHDQSRALGHAPIVDHNFRADHQAKAEWGREVERLKLIHMPDFDGLIYDFRTMAERVNARLKDEFGARFLRVRGALKVKCHLMFGIVALAVDQIIRSSTPGPPLPDPAGCTRPAQEKSPRSGYYARSSDYSCSRAAMRTYFVSSSFSLT